MRGIKLVNELLQAIEKENGPSVTEYIRCCINMTDFKTVEEMCGLQYLNVNCLPQSSGNLFWHDPEHHFRPVYHLHVPVPAIWVGMFDIIMNCHMIQKELNEERFDFDLADFIILHNFDIPIRTRNESKYLLRDYIEKYECATESIIEAITNFDKYGFWFPKLSEEDKKEFSKKFIYYLNSAVSTKVLSKNIGHKCSEKYLINIFHKIKEDISINIILKNQMMEHLNFRRKFYEGENMSQIDRVREMQKEMFESNGGIGFSLIDPPISYKENPFIEIKTKPVNSDKSIRFQSPTISVEIKPKKNPEE